jgi:tetratricopeptide (TPR) repeat protein
MALLKICLSGKFIGPAFLTFIIAVTATVLPTTLYADDLSDCTQAGDLPHVIVGCTNLLAAPSAPHDNRAIAYRNRSSAYAALGDFARAEQDYHRAVALNPQYVDSSYQDRFSTVEPYWLKSAPDP